MLVMRCDHVDDNWKPCTFEMSGFGFNAVPPGFVVKTIDPTLNMYEHYCIEHAQLRGLIHGHDPNVKCDKDACT
jgi:hypothetical protein